MHLFYHFKLYRKLTKCGCSIFWLMVILGITLVGTIIAGIVSTVAAPQCVLLLSGKIDDKYFDSFNPLNQPTISDDYIAFGIVQSPADDNFTHISRVCALRLHILETINQNFQPSASSCINLTRNFDTYILC